MPFNFQTFKTRALTALLFVAVMLVGLLWNFWSFVVLFTVIHFGCWYEFVKLLKKINKDKYLFYCFGGLVYITVPVLAIIYLRTIGMIYKDGCLVDDVGYIIPLGIIFSIWINDTMAYIVGSFIGKTPFSPISPKKTWEGTAGGALLTVIAAVVYGMLSHQWRIIDWIALSVLTAVAGTLGDLLESKLKRIAGVKDSGNLMPGHGGALDRFDSLIVAAPVVFVYVTWFMS